MITTITGAIMILLMGIVIGIMLEASPKKKK